MEQITISKEEVTVYAKGTKDKTCTVQLTEESGNVLKDSQVVWSVEDEAIAKIATKENTAVTITAKKAGMTTVKAVVTKGTETKTFTITVTVKKPSVKVTGSKKVKAGKSVTLKATTYGLKGKVTWKVDKKAIATISGKGKLKAKKAGKVKVTAKCGKYKSTYTITVK